MNILERVNIISKEFESFDAWEQKYSFIISLGKKLEHFPENEKIESNKIKGCQSQVWLLARFDNGKIYFEADSDAAITKGIIALLLQVYSNSTPDEILTFKPDFIDKIGLRQHLSMSRANGLNAMLKQMTFYALAFKAKMESSL